MPIVGTAGHVDHGKSTLVTALTGRDPDRWAEEKQRGLTIDLGFAWTELGDAGEVGFVDVPGHERFSKNMLAGVGALDVALMVVAADEGWMPQTEEHLTVLDLLDIRHGVIAITRVDLVDADMVELAQLEIQDAVAGSSLVDWPIIPVAAPTGYGITELADALGAQLAAAEPSADLGRPRMWVDRAFTIAGAGTVVTGTLTNGSVSTGEELELWPGPHRVRVRRIQSHETDLDVVNPGRRTALNVSGLDHTAIERGACLGVPDSLRPSRKLLVSLLPARGLDEPPSDRGAYQLHVGSGAWPVQLRLLRKPSADAAGTALVSLDRDLVVELGDRFILRDVGRRTVVGGGRVLDPQPRGNLATVRETAGRLAEAVDASPSARAQALLEIRGQAVLTDLAKDSGGGSPTTGIFTQVDALSVDSAAELGQSIKERVVSYQVANPLRPGIPRSELLSAFDLSTEMLALLLAVDDRLMDEGASIHTTDFAGRWGSDEEVAFAAAIEQLRGSGLAVPRATQLGLEPELLHAAIRSGRLVRLADDLVYLPEQVEEIVHRVQTLEEFTVAEFRDALGVSRRQAVPVLEWLDAQGWTSRRGDIRSIRRRPPPPQPGARLP